MSEENIKISKVEELEKKIEQLKAQKQALIAREKEKERKERTRRLIQIGAVIDSRLNFNLKEIDLLCDYLYKFPNSLNEIKKYIAQKSEICSTNIPKEKVDIKLKDNNDLKPDPKVNGADF